MDDRHRTFLTELGCLEIRHTGRSFFEHLKNTHDLLRDWGNSEDVCVAGLFHSIYGNEIFKHKTMTDRVALEKQIGEHAELLVHFFNTRKRPFFNDLPQGKIRDQLREIEAANLLEQGGAIKTLETLLRMKLSNGAKAAITMELAAR